MSDELSIITADRIEPLMVRVGLSTYLPNEIGTIATTDIDAGSIIGGTQIHPIEEHLCKWSEYENFDAGMQAWIDDYCLGTPEGFIIIGNPNYWPVMWTMNHHCDGNTGFDEEFNFVAIRDIKAGEEVCYDYGLGESNPAFKMQCTCSDSNCRKVITGNDWKSIRSSERNKYMMANLR